MTKQKRDVELINNIDLGNSVDYQALYSSQLYGTFFMVYGKFNAEKSEEDSSIYQIKSLRLRILNYKGPVDLKIQDAELHDLKDLDYVEKNGALLDIKVGVMEGSYKYDVTNFQTFNFTKGNEKEKKYLYVERSVKAMSNSEMNESNIFDDEYFYREGFTITQDEGNEDIKIKQARHKREITPSNPPKTSENNLRGGKRCPNSKNFII